MAAQDMSVDLAEHVIGFVADQNELQRENEALRRSNKVLRDMHLKCEDRQRRWEDRYHRCVDINPNLERTLALEDQVCVLTKRLDRVCETYEDFHGLQPGHSYGIPLSVVEEVFPLDGDELAHLIGNMSISPNEYGCIEGDDEELVSVTYVGVVSDERDKYGKYMAWIPTKDCYYVFECEFNRFAGHDFKSMDENRHGEKYRLSVSGKYHGEQLDAIVELEDVV